MRDRGSRAAGTRIRIEQEDRIHPGLYDLAGGRLISPIPPTLAATIATGLGLVIIVTGIILFPSRLGYYAWRRRRQARRAAAGGPGLQE